MPKTEMRRVYPIAINPETTKVTHFIPRLPPRQVPRYPGPLKVKGGSHRPGILMTALCLALISQTTGAGEPWTAPLAGGGQLQVDPRTHQPLISRGGQQTQLWDGAHRLQDGSVILVQEGRVVPRQDMLNPPSPAEEAGGTGPTATPATPASPITPPTSLHTGPLVGTPPCEQLVDKVCGQAIECWSKPACAAARQLRAMDHEELLVGANPGQDTQTGSQCREALKNGYFSPCPSAPTHLEGSAARP